MTDNAIAPYDHKLKSFEQLAKEVSCAIREVFADHNLGSFCFKMTVSGRTAAGGAKMTWSISEDTYGSSVEGSTIRPIIEELFRRKGFDLRNAPLELPSPGEAAEDEQVF